MLYNRKIKPSLIDQNIIGEYMKEKILSQIKVSSIQTHSELQKLSTRIFYNVVNFFYHYFFIIGIFLMIIYYMYKRYVWYQEIKKIQVQKQKQVQDQNIKKYFDDIMDDNESQHPTQQLTQYPIQQNKFNPSSQYLPDFAQGKKLDKVLSGNNGYLNHLKQTLDTTQAHTTSMGRIAATPELSTKTVRFTPGNFDAYGRNNLNPKTGQILIKQDTTSYDSNPIQAYAAASNFSSF